MNDTSETKMTKQEPQLVASFPKNKREEMRVRLTEWEGNPYVDVRVFFAAGEGEWIGTKKGVMMNADLLPELADAIEKAGEVLAAANNG